MLRVTLKKKANGMLTLLIFEFRCKKLDKNEKQSYKC